MAVQVKIPDRKMVGENSSDKIGGSQNENYFYTVKLEESPLKVILYLTDGDPLGHTVLKRCLDADYNCCLVHGEEAVLENLRELRHQAIVLVDVQATTSLPGSSSMECNSLDHLSQYIRLHGLEQTVGIMGIVKDWSSDKNMNRLLQNGVSRILTRDDCLGDRLIWEIKMVQKTEVALREKLIFGLALYEAVDQSGDAIQITGNNSKIMYVNRAFLDISGYSVEEVIGQPAWDILRPFDSKSDNGPKGAVRKGQSWDGICMGRRKSGSQLKQHLKLIPIRGSADSYVYHHVTIQRLLSINDARPNDIPFLTKTLSLSKIIPRLESPIIKAVQMLNSAREGTNIPPSVKEALDKAIETLCNSELYTIPSSGRPSGGIVAGLLQSGKRYSPSPFSLLSKMSPHTAHVFNPPITPPPPVVSEALLSVNKWEFDIIDMESLSKHRPLYYIGMEVFKKFDLCKVLNIEIGVLASWLKLMENHYHSQNAYHNSTHAADVLQATAYFVNLLQDSLVSQGDVLECSEVAALLITAAIHDLDHPGRTNPYLCNTRHELAILYNDNAVLENHHVSLCFKLTEHSNEVNIFKNLDESTFRSLRTSIIDLVLATDMAKHFEYLAKFNITLVEGESGSSSNLNGLMSKEENRMIMKKILVKCADISNPCRPLPLCKVWAKRIAEEYFTQTEDEKQQNIPVVFPDFDRQTCKLPVTQVKFIDYFIMGLFDSWNNFCPIPALMEYIKSNYDFWKSKCPDSPSYSEEESDTSPNETASKS